MTTEAPADEPVHQASKGGRPTLYCAEFVRQAKKLCELGATDVELADFFGVSIHSIHLWRVKHRQFSESTKLGKEAADRRVERALYARAVGYEHDDTDIRVADGEVIQTPIRKHYPPDTAAASLWLRNRRPDLWRDRVESLHGGVAGSPIEVIGALTDEEKAARIAQIVARGAARKAEAGE